MSTAPCTFFINNQFENNKKKAIEFMRFNLILNFYIYQLIIIIIVDKNNNLLFAIF